MSVRYVWIMNIMRTRTCAREIFHDAHLQHPATCSARISTRADTCQFHASRHRSNTFIVPLDCFSYPDTDSAMWNAPYVYIHSACLFTWFHGALFHFTLFRVFLRNRDLPVLIYLPDCAVLLKDRFAKSVCQQLCIITKSRSRRWDRL